MHTARPRHGRRVLAVGWLAVVLFFAFTMRLSPARRMVYAIALVLAFIGLVNLFRGIGLVRVGPALPFGVDFGVPGPLFREGTWSLFLAFALMNLLVLLDDGFRDGLGDSLIEDVELLFELPAPPVPNGLPDAGDRVVPGVHAGERQYVIAPLA